MTTGITRARTRTGAERRPVVDKGIKDIIQMVTEGRWRSGIGHAEIEAKYNITPVTSRAWATQAHRLLRMAIGEGEDIRARLVVMLEDIHHRAIEAQSVTKDGQPFDSPDLRSAISAISEMGKLLGLVETKHKVDVTIQAFAALRPPEMLAKVREQLRGLAEVEKRLALEVEGLAGISENIIDVEVIDDE